MKRNTSLTVSEFHQMVARMIEQADAELRAAQQRMESLRSTTMPPG